MADLKDLLPDDLKANPSITKFADAGALAKGYLELEAFRGTSIRIPGPEAGDADKAEFRAKLQKSAPSLVELPEDDVKVIEGLRTYGRIPKEAKDYSFDGVTFEPGTELSPEEQGKARQWALDRGLTKAAFKAEVAEMAKTRAAGKAAVAANEAELRKEFGQAFDDRMKGYRVLAEQVGAPQAMKDAIAANRITKDEAAWLDRLGKQMGLGESRELANLGNSPTPKLTPGEIRERLTEALKKGNDWNLPAEARMEAFKAAERYQAMLTPEG